MVEMNADLRPVRRRDAAAQALDGALDGFLDLGLETADGAAQDDFLGNDVPRLAGVYLRESA